MWTLIQLIRARQYRRRYCFRQIQIDELLTSDLILDLRGWDSDKRAGDLFDGLLIGAIARTLRPKLYWEIGTGDGRTALLVARNTPPDTKIFTLDAEFPSNPVKGKLFRDHEEATKIKQFGDFSSRFDFSDWFGKVDLVFVDGSHDFADVLADCDTAFRLVSPTGWILWHDVAMDTPGVPKALSLCSRAESIEMIQGSRYALYRSDGHQ